MPEIHAAIKPVQKLNGEIIKVKSFTARFEDKTKFIAEIKSKPRVSAAFNYLKAIKAELRDLKVVSTDPEPYRGSYNVKPKAFTPQTLETEGKTMQANVLVQEIPYFAVSNEQGGTTLIIGGD